MELDLAADVVAAEEDDPAAAVVEATVEGVEDANEA